MIRNIIISLLICLSTGLYADRVDDLINQLKVEDDSLRIEAIAELSTLSDRRILKPLIKALKDENEEVRILAVSALGNLGDKRAVRPLISFLEVEGKTVKNNVLKALLNIGKPAETYLIRAAESDSFYVRTTAFLALVGIESKKIVDIAYELITKGSEEETEEAMKMIVKLEKDEFLPFFIKSLEDPRDKIIREAEAGLMRLGDVAFKPVMQLLESRNAGLRLSAINILGGIGDKRATEPLKEISLSDSVNLRMAAIKALGYIGDSEIQDFLLSFINDEDAGIRRYTLDALGRVGDEKVVPVLIDIFRDEESTFPWYAVSALREIGEPAEPFLIQVLNDETKEVRKYSALALGEIRAEAAMENLYSMLMDPDEEIEVKTAVLKGMANISSKKIFKGLLDVFDYNELELSRAATDILIRIGEPAVEPFITLLGSKYETARRCARKGLITLKRVSVEPLIKSLQTASSNTSIRIIEILGEIGDERVVNSLLEKLKSRNISVKIAVVDAMGKIGNEEAIEPLLEIIVHKDRTLALKAIQAIGRIGLKCGDRVIEPLLQALESGNPKIRKEAITALGRTGNRKVTQPLIEMLNDRNSEIRRSVVTALGAIGDERAVESLKKSLDDLHPDVRRDAVKSLGKIGGTEAVGAVVFAVEDNARNVRLAAAEVLKYNIDLLTEDAVEPLSRALRTSDTYVGTQLAYILGSMGSKSVNALLEILGEEGKNTRKYAAQALGWTNDVSAVPSLIEALKDDDAGVRIAATQSLGVLKDGRAVEPLAKQIMDDNRSIRIASVTALGNIEEGRAAVLLQIALNDKDEAVRDAAAKALAKLTGQSCPLITGLSRFNITGFLWFIFLGFILVLPFIGSRIKPTSKWLDRISPNRLPQRIRWWVMIVLGLGALALYIYCFICKTELGAPIFALEKPLLLDVLWLYSFRVFPFFIGGCILSGWILRYFSGKRHLPSSMLGSTTLGAIIPLCSCAVIPMAMGMLRSKGTVRAVIAFLVATPILSPFIIILSYGIMGIAYTIIRIISVFLIAIVMGILIERTVGRELEDDSMRMVDMCKGCAMSRAGHNPSNSVLLIAWNQVSYLLKYMVIGLLIGALLEAYLPASIVLRYMSSNFLGLIASATVGIPIYLCSGQDVLILKPLMDMGLPMGHAMAFTIGANGICLTSIALLVGAIGRKTTIMMTALFWVGAIIIGYLINIAFLAV